MIAGKPVKMVQRNDIKPSTRLAIAIALVGPRRTRSPTACRGAAPRRGSGPHRLADDQLPAALGTLGLQARVGVGCLKLFTAFTSHNNWHRFRSRIRAGTGSPVPDAIRGVRGNQGVAGLRLRDLGDRTSGRAGGVSPLSFDRTDEDRGLTPPARQDALRSRVSPRVCRGGIRERVRGRRGPGRGSLPPAWARSGRPPPPPPTIGARPSLSQLPACRPRAIRSGVSAGDEAGPCRRRRSPAARPAPPRPCGAARRLAARSSSGDDSRAPG